MEDELVKVIVIGEALAGKTSFIHRYVNNTFHPGYKATIGVDFSLKVIHWTDTANIKLQLWDIAGQERFTFMTRAYYKDAKGCLLLFDVTNKKSFDQVVRWKQDLDSKTRLADGSILPCLLVANKTDLEDKEVTHAEITDMCSSHQFVGWTETSAKDGHMVKESIAYLLDIIMGKSPGLKDPDKEFTDSIALGCHKKRKSRCAC